MTLYRVSDLKNNSVEDLIAKLVYNSITIAHKGRASNMDLENEKRIVKELGKRVDSIDANVLLEKISK